MATDPKWIDAQIKAAVQVGINVLDAQTAMRALLALLPADADPAMLDNLPPFALEQDLTRAEILADARSDWYADVEARYARLLDAVLDNGR